MVMLAEVVELVIGVDTHKDTHTAAVVAAATGAVLAQATVPATPAGYRQLLRLADRHDGRRVWAIEGTGGYGAGLTRFLHGHQEQVVELDRPKPARPWAATTSPSQERLVTVRPCQCGWPPGVRQSRPPPTPNANSTPSWSQPPTPSADGCATSPHPAWSAPAGGFGSRSLGTPRPPPPRPACAPWPAASNT